jgi:hypothetical protein
VCFEKKILHDPLEILCSACAYIRYWAGLFPEVMKEAIEEGVDLMLQTAIKLLDRKKAKTIGSVLAIEAKKAPNSDDDAPS